MTDKPTLRSVLSLALVVGWGAFAPAAALDLPSRGGETPRTTDSVPHVQIGISPDPTISAELLRRADELPGVSLRKTIVSLPGAKGFWIDEGIVLARPNAIVRGREFAHMHPDGSLHASLSPATAEVAVDAGWAIRHPWAATRPGWEGFVMIYTPTTADELDVVMQLVRASYDFVTGASAAQ